MNAAGNTSFIYRARARLRNAPARSGQLAIRGAFLQPLACVRETRQRGVGNSRFAAAFFSPLRAFGRRESAEWATRDSRRLSSALRARPRDAKARSGQLSIRGGFLQPLARVRETRIRLSRPEAPCSPQPLARVRETRQRGAGNARFAAAFFCPSRASARRESAERAKRESRRFSSAPRARPRDAPARSGQRAIRGGFLQPLARIRETRQRGVGNARFTAAFFNTSRASARRESAERATCESRCFLSAPRAHPGGAPAWSRQRAIHGGFLQPLARVCETRKRGAGNTRFAAAFFSPSRASARRASVERVTRDSRRLSSTSRARPRDAPARSGQRSIRGGFLQPLARVREMRQRGAGNTRFAAAFFDPSRASARCASAERATRDSRRLSSTSRAYPRDAPARSGQRAIRRAFLQSLARIRETRKRGAGNARFAAAFFSPLRASGRRESAERETHDSRRLSSVPRAAPRNAKARSGQRANRGAFFQPLARIREARQRGVGSA